MHRKLRQNIMNYREKKKSILSKDVLCCSCKDLGTVHIIAHDQWTDGFVFQFCWAWDTGILAHLKVL